MEVGNDEITLRLGKQSNKRHLQFALQSLVSLFSKFQILLANKKNGVQYVYLIKASVR